METLDVSEIVNLLPYSVLEEALEYDVEELLREFSNKHPGCKPDLNNIQKTGLESLMLSIDLEGEVEKEVKKMMNSNSLYDALINSLPAGSLNDLLSDAIPSIPIN